MLHKFKVFSTFPLITFTLIPSFSLTLGLSLHFHLKFIKIHLLSPTTSTHTRPFCTLCRLHLLPSSIRSTWYSENKIFQNRQLIEISKSELVIVAAHAGGAKRARRIARKLGLKFAMVDKRRLDGSNEYEAMNIVGDLTPTAIIVEDMIDTGSSVTRAAEALKSNGVEDVYVCATHGVFSAGAIEKINQAPIKEVMVTNSISHPQLSTDGEGKVLVLSVSSLLGEAIRRIHNEESVSSLFTM
eukprot:TRINITY_DN555_c1_g2_i1.p1 TRINITY_DN555_c1_g2~~TRINITY_DN555_c1_g2_i1.p1  ORF type:complete len:242 (+),score=38.46 TRINITY_DN555_c1_g2_i1:173-898(+)